MSPRKMERYIDRADLPGFLRDLADALEGKGPDDMDCPEEFDRLKITAKERYGKMELKVKASPGDLETCLGSEDTPLEAAANTDKPSYKTLKKRMKNSFKIIFRMIHDDQLPPAQAVEEFMEDSKLMVTYPGYGDEYYAEYLEVCEAFAEAYRSEDMEALHKTVDMVQSLVSHCHARYK